MLAVMKAAPDERKAVLFACARDVCALYRLKRLSHRQRNEASRAASSAPLECPARRFRAALLEAAKEQTPEAQTATIRRLAERKASTAEPAAPAPSAKPLRDLVGISGGELARWIKITTPNDRPHVIRVLEMAAAILRDELEDKPGLGL